MAGVRASDNSHRNAILAGQWIGVEATQVTGKLRREEVLKSAAGGKFPAAPP